MVVSTSAIVISKLKYKDNDLILKLLTRELGVCNFLVRNPAGKKRNVSLNQYREKSRKGTFFSQKRNFLRDINKIKPHF